VGATYGSAKIWPAALAAQFAQHCFDAGIRLLLLGDASAQDHVQAIKKTCPAIWADRQGDEAGAVDLTGATGLMDVVEILRGVDVFIGNDSGLMHLSAALGTPTLGLFGPTNPAWTSPRGRCTSVLSVSEFECSPCYRRTCPEPRFCMETLAAEAVYQAALELEGRRS
jgi:heptosyltransferase-2